MTDPIENRDARDISLDYDMAKIQQIDTSKWFSNPLTPTE